MLNDLRQVLPPVLTRNVSNTRRKVEHAPLRDRPLHERRDVRLRVPYSLETARDTQVVEEARDSLEEVRADRVVRDRGDGRVRRRHPVEDRERLAVPVGRGGRGELEHGGSWERNTALQRVSTPEALWVKSRYLRDTVRDDGVVNVVSGVLVLGTLLVQTGDLKRVWSRHGRVYTYNRNFRTYRIADPVAEVHTGISKADARE